MPTVKIHQKLTPCLWFDFNARDAVTLYTTIDEAYGSTSKQLI